MSSTRPHDSAWQPPVWLDAHQVRVLAHPLRARLLGHLRIDGPATATGLAKAMATNTGATSYHLRQLAEAGLVVEEPGGTGRQRFWRAAHQSHAWWNSDFAGDPDTVAALDWIAGHQQRAVGEWAEKWARARWSSPREWQDAATASDVLLTINPARLRALTAEVAAVIRRYRGEPDTGPDARQVLLAYSAFPRMEARP